MDISFINLRLELGSVIPSPAPREITQALDSVEVTQTDNHPATFQLVFRADRTRGFSPDFKLLQSSLLTPSTRVIITVTINGSPTVLMDGLITRQELTHDREFGASTFTVTGEDVSVAMDLIQISMGFPQMGDSVIALFVLAKYVVLGVLPMVVPSVLDIASWADGEVPQQAAETDRAFLQRLASDHGNIFYVRPGPTPLTNIAYWGPPDRSVTPQSALTVDMGPATNVEKISFQFNALASTIMNGMFQDTDFDVDFPLTTFASTRQPSLAENPALGFAKLFQRRQIFQGSFSTFKAIAMAQAQTDISTDETVVAHGELDTLRYGSVLQAPGLVGLRGVGLSYDGLYYVSAVTHSLGSGRYKQSFTLTREGLESTVSTVTP